MKAVNSQKLTQQCRHSSRCVLSLAEPGERQDREENATHTHATPRLIDLRTDVTCGDDRKATF